MKWVANWTPEQADELYGAATQRALEVLFPMNSIDKKWRIGSQTGRSIYFEEAENPEMKDPSQFIAVCIGPQIEAQVMAEHIIEIHNWWLEVHELVEKVWPKE